jgi:hypothetical protein
MPLTANFQRPLPVQTATEAISVTSIGFDNDTLKYRIEDTYATVNAAIRLIKREVRKPVYSFANGASIYYHEIYEIDVASTAASVYDPTTITTATAGLFAIPSPLPPVLAKTAPINLNTRFISAGDLPS